MDFLTRIAQASSEDRAYLIDLRDRRLYATAGFQLREKLGVRSAVTAPARWAVVCRCGVAGSWALRDSWPDAVHLMANRHLFCDGCASGRESRTLEDSIASSDRRRFRNVEPATVQDAEDAGAMMVDARHEVARARHFRGS